MPHQGVVVGATSDIGLAVAVMMAQQGLSLVLIGRDGQKLDQSAATCRASSKAHQTVSTVVLDVTDYDTVVSTVQSLAESGPLTVAVWVAGVFDWAPTQEADPGRWANVIDTNLTSAAVFTAAVAPLLVRAAPSALVFIGSGASHQAFAGNAAYVASKHGLAGLAGSTFLDLRDDGVKVSLVSPGLVAAGAGLSSPAGVAHPDRLLRPTDVADAVRFVLTSSDRACPTVIQLQPQATL